MAKKLIATSFVVFALIASTPAFAAVGGSNPRPQAVADSGATSQAVGGSNPRPQIGSGSGEFGLLSAIQVYMGL